MYTFCELLAMFSGSGYRIALKRETLSPHQFLFRGYDVLDHQHIKKLAIHNYDTGKNVNYWGGKFRSQR
jgi:hypothetical protein